MQDFTKIDVSQIVQNSPTEISIPQPPIVVSLDELNHQMAQLAAERDDSQHDIDNAAAEMNEITSKITALQAVIDAASNAGVQTMVQAAEAQSQLASESAATADASAMK